MANSAIQDLLAVLDREGEALRIGDLAEIAVIADEKSKLGLALESQSATQAELEILRAKASANASLLAAAIRGIKAARSRLEALSEVRDTLSVYGPTGQLDRVATGQSDVERKA
jgi:flagellar biosynthesis/type III secretory pathway chaperone